MLTTFGRPGLPAPRHGAGRRGLPAQGRARRASSRARSAARCAGERVVDPGLAAAALSEGHSPLTAREHEVLRGAREHATVADIAPALHLSPGTVRNYLSASDGQARRAATAPRRSAWPRTRAGCRPGLLTQRHGAAKPGFPHRLRPRPRLHGHDRVLRPGATTHESIATIHRALDLGVTLFDTADMYGPAPTRSSSAARSPAAATRSCSPRSSASSATSARPALDRQPPGVHPPGVRGVAAAPRRRPHRPLLHAPPRPGGAARGDRRRDGRARGRGQGAATRPVAR